MKQRGQYLIFLFVCNELTFFGSVRGSHPVLKRADSDRVDSRSLGEGSGETGPLLHRSHQFRGGRNRDSVAARTPQNRTCNGVEFRSLTLLDIFSEKAGTDRKAPSLPDANWDACPILSAVYNG
jgi:hypothetical protein